MSMKKIGLFVVITAMLLVSVGFGLRYFVREMQEGHAKSSLVVDIDLADQAIDIFIPQGRYRKAVDLAQAIVVSYPVGAVLPEGHSFADEYTALRQEQLERIAVALQESTGINYGTDWEKWSVALSEKNRSD